MPIKRVRHRNSHRAEIKRRLYRKVDRLWDGLLGVLMAGLILWSFGVSMLGDQKTRGFGIILIVFSFFFLLIYQILCSRLKRIGWLDGWFDLKDHIMIGVVIVLLTFAENKGVMLFGFASMSLALTYRAYQFTRPYWYKMYFRVARAYFRDVAKWNRQDRYKLSQINQVSEE